MSDLPALLDRVDSRYPGFLVDTIAEHEPGSRLVAYKNVTVNEDFFQGHFPGTPLMPGVLLIEALTQAASLLILERTSATPNARIGLRGVNDAKFRRQVARSVDSMAVLFQDFCETLSGSLHV